MAKKRFRLFSKDRGFYESDEPGQFAAITTQKVAGRLDCKSGKQAKPENRIFLCYLEDAPEGFRYCQKCKPEVLRVGDRLDYLEGRAGVLASKPHIALWATGMVKENNPNEYEPVRWYVSMDWVEHEGDEPVGCQFHLSPHYRYHRAYSQALKDGKKLNLPVIKHAVVDMVILWLPTQKSTPQQEGLIKDML